MKALVDWRAPERREIPPSGRNDVRGVRLDYGEGQETAEVQERFIAKDSDGAEILPTRADPCRKQGGKKKSARCARNDVLGSGAGVRRGVREGQERAESQERFIAKDSDGAEILSARADPLQEARRKKKSARCARNDVRGEWGRAGRAAIEEVRLSLGRQVE
jgi:hypothetical protein